MRIKLLNRLFLVMKAPQKSLLIAGLIASMLGVSASGLLTPSVEAASSLPAHAPNQLIVKFNGYVKTDAKEKLLSRLKGRQVNQLKLIQADLIQVPNDRDLSAWINLYKSSSLVAYAEPNYEVSINAPPGSSTPSPSTSTITNDPLFNKLWGLHNTGQDSGKADADIDAPEAWGNYTPSRSIVVGVIDTGVDYNHTDLKTNMWKNPGEIANNGKDDDANGYVDDVYGWDFANNDKDPYDDNSHGTHVAGTIAAIKGNSYGVTGVVGSGQVKIMALKFLRRNGSGYAADAIKALEYAGKNGALITNNSWGGGGYSQAMVNAIQNYQGLFVAAAGNSGLNTDTTPHYPAAYNLANIISVAATTSTDQLASFSNFGAASVDLGAPGSGILSTLPKNSFGTYSGTSMAAPHVSGVAAMVWTQHAGYSAASVKSTLLNSARPIPALAGKTVTGGVVNAAAAL